MNEAMRLQIDQMVNQEANQKIYAEAARQITPTMIQTVDVQEDFQ